MRHDIFHGHLPSIAGTKTGPLLIVGPGWCVKEDLKHAPDYPVMAVNAAAMFLRDLEHWYTPHPEYCAAMSAVRGFFHLEPARCPVHSAQGARGADIMWPILGSAALSGGIQAVVVAIEMGYAPVILAGMPADGKGHCYPHPNENGWATSYDHGQKMFLDQWAWLRDGYFDGKVTSLSGKTKEILG